MKTGGTLFFLAGAFLFPAFAAFPFPAGKPDSEAWVELMGSVGEELFLDYMGETEPEIPETLVAELSDRIEKEFPYHWDWMLQDSGGKFGDWLDLGHPPETLKRIVAGAIDGLDKYGGDASGLRAEFASLVEDDIPALDKEWLALYARTCELRREARLKNALAKWRRFVFARHFNMGGSHYAYTEGQSDAQNERHFRPGAALCVLEMDGNYGSIKTLLEDANGVIRNPDVSWDGKRILFAWKKSDREDDYHLYEMDAGSGEIRQLTFGLGFADYEGVYLPDGGIVFNSTRCVQTVDCWWTEVSNLFACDGDGGFLRRLSYDQVHVNFPTMARDGRVLYTRWDYSDRGQLFPQGLFQMYPDGTAQTEFYGNNSIFPTTLLHARHIPGTTLAVAIATGHHTYQAGKLAIVDVRRGRQENSGVQLVAPVRNTAAVRVDAYGQEGDLFQYPYPVNENEFVLTYHPLGWRGKRDEARFGIYWMDVDGGRELLCSDPAGSCNQPVPFAARERPHMRPFTPDYRKSRGVYYIQNIYEGDGLKGVPHGTIKRLRVVALEFRAAGIGNNSNYGPGGFSFVSTPVAWNNGSWDVKIIVGDADIMPDGSAYFKAPARMPLFFQALDEKGHAVQTMRSWSTLQPGEIASCVGCHENKNMAPPVTTGYQPQALKGDPVELRPFYGPPRGFSFQKEIQPILDAHCAGCHNDRSVKRGERSPASTEQAPKAFSLLGETTVDEQSKRAWSDAYLNLVRGGPHKLVNWVHAQSEPPMLPPYSAGAAKSALVEMLAKGHRGVELNAGETDKIAAWIDLLVPFCGDYTEANAWNEEEKEKYARYRGKRLKMEELERENIRAFLEK